MKVVSEVFSEPVRAPVRRVLSRSLVARRSTRSLARDEGGAVSVILAIMLVALLGMLGLAMDLGKVWNLDTQLQHGADAGALVGVTQLDGTDGARVRAIKAVVSELANNAQIFANDQVDADSNGSADGIDIEFDTTETIDTGSGKAINRDIKFYTALPIDPANESTNDAEARFIEVKVWPRTAQFSYAVLVGAPTSASPGARAVAGWESLYCDTPMMMMCNPAEDPDGDPTAPFNMYTDCPDYGDGPSCVGRGITMKARAGSPVPGDFGYLALQSLAADGTVTTLTGANDLKDALASVDFVNVCTGNQVTTEPGNMASLDQYINQRFDLYPDLATAMSANHQPAANVGRGLMKKASFNPGLGKCKYSPQSNSDPGDWKKPEDTGGDPRGYRGPGKHVRAGVWPAGTTVPDPGTMGEMDPPIWAMAYPKDACNYTISDTDETEFETAIGGINGPLQSGVGGCLFKAPPGDSTPEGDQIGSGQWDIQAYLDVYHPSRMEQDFVSPCNVDLSDPMCADLPNSLDPPLPRDGKISRWELYNWEKRYEAATNTYPNMAFEEEPICYRGGESFTTDYNLPEAPAALTAEDRRIVIMAVVNCAAMGGGRRTVPRAKPHGEVAVFLTEPMGYTMPDTLYGELVDPRGLKNDEVDPNLNFMRERIQLIE